MTQRAQFDDAKLQRVADRVYRSFHTEARPEEIKVLLTKEKLDNHERNQLLDFIYRSNTSRPSMRQMRDDILEAIGAPASYSHAGTLSRDDLERIWLYIRTIK